MRLFVQKNSIIKKLLIGFATLVLTILSINYGTILNKKQADAIYYSDTTSYVTVDEIWDSTQKKFNEKNLQTLYNLVNGAENSTYANLRSKSRKATDDGISGYSSKSIRAGTYGKTNSQDIVVKFGGLTWSVVYLSTDLSDTEDTILTLWLTGEQEAWNDKSSRAGDYYGFVNSTDTKAGLYSCWSANVSNNYFTINNPTMMYGSSYINAVTLNNGGAYVSGISGTDASASTTISTANQSDSSVFAEFTMSSYGLTEYLVKPKDVIWQTTQSMKTSCATYSSISYSYANENSAAYNNLTFATDSTFGGVSDIINNQYYYNWADNYLWLPSISETGGFYYSYYWSSNGNYHNHACGDGIWEASDSQTLNYKSDTTKISLVGKQNVDAYGHAWTRTASSSNLTDHGHGIGKMSLSGNRSTYTHYYSSTCSDSYRPTFQSLPNCCYAVRPALHLNLTKAEANKYSPKKDISECTIGTIASVPWTPGLTPEPTFTITNPDKNVTLIKGTDYTVTVPTVTEPGDVTITITGIGENYKGTTTATLQVSKRDINVALKGQENDTALVISNQLYTGSPIRPPISGLKDYGYETNSSSTQHNPGGTALVEGTDYELTYSNNTSVGTATITITGKGKYDNTKKATRSFVITAPTITGGRLTITPTTTEYNFGANFISSITPTLVVSSTTLQRNTDYTLSFYNAAGTTALGDISAVGTYIVRATGTGSYSGSVDTTFTVTQKSLLSDYITVTGTAPTYNGNSQTVTFTVSAPYVSGGVSTAFTFVKDRDYTVEFSNNINAGNTATIKINGMGNFNGSATKTFTINPKTISGVKTSTVLAQAYTGNELKPTIVVTDEALSKTLTLDTDYTLTYSNNTNVGQATITIFGKGNYNPVTQKVINFEITARDISNANISDIGDQPYTGKNIEPTITVTDDGKTLSLRTDYTVEYDNNLNVSSNASVTITGTGNYTGTKRKIFSITKANLTGVAKVVLNPKTVVYTGRSVSTDVSVTVNGNTISAENYEITVLKGTEILKNKFADVIAVGTYTIRISGVGNYEGTAQSDFEITKYNIEAAIVNLSSNTFQYNKSAQVPIESVTFGGTKLIKGEDYTVSYHQTATTGPSIENPTNVNRYYVVLTGKGNYEGTNSRLYFDITPVSLRGTVKSVFSDGTETIEDNRLDSTNIVFDNTSKKLELLTLTINGATFYSSSIRDYVICEYLRNGVSTIDFTHAGIITMKITSINDNVTGDRTYTYEIKRRNLSTINKSDLNVEGLEEFTYDRTPHNTLNLTIKDYGADLYTLIQGEDYSIDYGGNSCINAGTVTINILGNANGNYQGSTTREFIINPATINNTFTLSATSGEYSTRPHILSAVVKSGDLTLTANEYSLQYYRNGIVSEDTTNVGNIVVKLQLAPGNVNFVLPSNMQNAEYEITAVAIKSVILSRTSQIFDNNFHELKITSVIAGSGNISLLPTDYEAVYLYEDTNANVPLTEGKYMVKNAGTYKVKVSAKNNTETNAKNAIGENIEATFNITRREITSSVIKYYYVKFNESTGKNERIKDSNGNDIQVDLETNYRGQRVEPEITMLLPNASGGGVDTYKLVITTSPDSASPDNDFKFSVYDVNNRDAGNIFKTDNYLSLGEYEFEIVGINNFAGTIKKVYKVNVAEFNGNCINLDISKTKNLSYTGQPITFVFNTSPTNSPNEIVVWYDDTKYGGSTSGVQQMELYRGDHFELFDGWVMLDVTDNNVTNIIDVTEEVKNDSTYPENHHNVFHIENGYVNNNSVGWATLVIKSINSVFRPNLVAKQFKITKLGLDAENTHIALESSYPYTGSPVINSVEDIVVTKGSERLTYGVDYDLKFTVASDSDDPNVIKDEKESNLIDAGRVRVTLTALNTYEGGFNTTIFTISRKMLAETMFTVSENVVYDKLSHKPSVSGTFNSKELVLGTDYTITYKRGEQVEEDFILVGTITIEITGIGNFDGTCSPKFVIQPQTIGEIVLSRPTATYNGSSNIITAVVKDVLGNNIDTSEYTLVGFEEDGYTDAGTYDISVSVETIVDGNYIIPEGTKISAKFVINKASLGNATGTISSKIFTGYRITPDIEDIALELNSFSIPSSEFEVESVENSVNVGTATAVLKATENNFTGTLELPFEIRPKDIGTYVNIGEYQTQFIYNGESQAPTFYITYAAQTLELGVDYYLEINREDGIPDDSDTPNKNVGNFKVIINGDGNYEGRLEREYSIVQRSLKTDCTTTITLDGEVAGYVYTGEEIKPDITEFIASFGVKNLVLDSSEYVATYFNFISAGEAYIELEGKGNFKDKVTKYYTISQRTLVQDELDIEIKNKTYTGSKITLLDSDVNIMLNIAENKAIKITSENYDIIFKVPNVIDASTYAVTIRGKNNYKGTAESSVKVVPISLEDDIASITYKGDNPNELSIVYTGFSIEQKLIENLVVKIGEISLTHGYDFVIEYANSNSNYLINAGDKEFTIRESVGNKNITGTRKGYFKVEKQSLENENVTFAVNEEKYVYTGERITPNFDLVYNNKDLVEGTDYEISYTNCVNFNNDDSAVIEIVANFDGNFYGKLTYRFSIEQATPELTFSIPDQKFFAGDVIDQDTFKVITSTESSVNNLLLLADETSDNKISLIASTTGEFRLKKSLTLVQGSSNNIEYEFIPTGANARNYKQLTNKDNPIRITAVYYYSIVYKYENKVIEDETTDIVAGNNARVIAEVKVKNGERFDTVNSANYRVITTLTGDSNAVVDYISVAGRYIVSVEMIGSSDIYSVEEGKENITFYAKSNTLYCTYAPFYAYISNGYFEEGVTLEVDVLQTKRDITNIITSENYDNITNIGKMYYVKGFEKNGVPQSLDNVTIFFTPTSSSFYTFSGGSLSGANNESKTEVDLDSYYIEFEPAESNSFVMVIIIAVAAVAVIIIAIVVVKAISNKKLKKASYSNSIDMDKVNALANSASIAKANQAQQQPNVSALHGGINSTTPLGVSPQPQQGPANLGQQNIPPKQPMPNQQMGGMPQRPPMQQGMPQGQNMPPRQGMMPPNGMPQGQGMPPRPNSPMPQNGTIPPMQNNGMAPRPPMPNQQMGGMPRPPMQNGMPPQQGVNPMQNGANNPNGNKPN